MDLYEYDYVITIGGDGTFLSAAHFIEKPELKILGINSDSKNSVGHLCSYALNFETIENVFKRLADDEYSVLRRKRARVDLYKENAH